MFCTGCGTQLKETQKFCTNCGSPIEVRTPTAGSRSSPPVVPVPVDRQTASKSSLAPAIEAVLAPTSGTLARTAPLPRPVPVPSVTRPTMAGGTAEIGRTAVHRNGISSRLVWGGVGALVVVALAAVLLFLHSRNQPLAVSDADIEKSIQAKFAADPDISKCTLEVRSQNGVVTLTGLVNKPSDRAIADNITRQQAGVRTTVDNLVLATASQKLSKESSSPGTLRLFAPQIDSSARTVVLNGVDTARPTTPFHFDWGDGSESVGFFPQTKVYDQAGTYTIRVVASYPDGSHGSAETVAKIP